MPGGLSQDGGQEDSLKMEGARRTLLRWREPGGPSRDRGSQEDPLESRRRRFSRRDSGHCSQSAGEASRDQFRRLSATNLLSQPALPMMDQQCHFILHTT